MGALLLSLFIINLGIALGAGLYESRIVVPQWLVRSSDGRTHWNAAAAVAANVGLRFWVYVTTVPLTLLTIANLFAALQAAGPVRSWWLTAVIAAALDRASTFGYFIPTMLRLTRPDGPTGADAARLATRWAQLDYVRHGLTLLALAAALCALTLLTEPKQT
jgi:hypothetical protein